MYIIPQLKGKEIILYLRKSRADDPLLTVEEVLEKHEQLIADWTAHAMPDLGEIPSENTYREVVSGETLDGRPRMMELLRRIESPEIKAILCKEPSRLSRGDLQDIGYLVKILRYTGTVVLTPRGCYDLRDDRDREQFERELMRGNDYLEYQKKLMYDGKLIAVKKGHYIGSRAPYGYKKTSFKEGGRTCRTLEPHPDEAPVVKRIFELYAGGIGTVKICDILEAEFIKPMDGDQWSPGSIREILQNPHYIGKVRWNYRPNSNQVEDGEIIKRRLTAEDVLIFEGRHPAIVSQELWDAVQEIRGKIPKTQKAQGLKNPLACIIRCSCGRAMTYHQTQRGGKFIGRPRLQCSATRCKENGTAIMEDVIAEVIRVLQECIDDFEVRIEAGVDNSAEIHQKLVERLEKRLENLRELETKQWDEKIKGDIPPHVFDTLNAKTVAEIAEVSQALCDAKDATPVHVDLQEQRSTFYAALNTLKDPDAPIEEQNKLLRACIEQIVYRRPVLRPGKYKNTPPFELEFTLRV